MRFPSNFFINRLIEGTVTADCTVSSNSSSGISTGIFFTIPRRNSRCWGIYALTLSFSSKIEFLRNVLAAVIDLKLTLIRFLPAVCISLISLVIHVIFLQRANVWRLPILFDLSTFSTKTWTGPEWSQGNKSIALALSSFDWALSEWAVIV